jgi:hypothetical protein
LNLGRVRALNLKVVVAADATMPKGHDWAVVTLPEQVVFLVAESTVRRSGVDPCAVNEALRRAG